MLSEGFDLRAFAYGYITCLVVIVLVIAFTVWLSKLVDKYEARKMPLVSADVVRRYFGEKDAGDSPVVKESPRQRQD